MLHNDIAICFIKCNPSRSIFSTFTKIMNSSMISVLILYSFLYAESVADSLLSNRPEYLMVQSRQKSFEKTKLGGGKKGKKFVTSFNFNTLLGANDDSTATEIPSIQPIELTDITQKAQKADKPPSANERVPWHEEMLVYSLLYGKRPENHYRTSVWGSINFFSVVIVCSSYIRTIANRSLLQ